MKTSRMVGAIAALIATTCIPTAPQALTAEPYIERSVEHAQAAYFFTSTCPKNRRVGIPGPACSMTDILAVSVSDPTGQPAPAYLHIERQSLTPAVGYPSGFMWFRLDFGLTFDGAQLAVERGMTAATASGQVPVVSCDQLWDTEARQPRTAFQCSSGLWQIDSDWTATGNGHASYHGYAFGDYDSESNWIRVGADSSRGRHATANALVDGVVVTDDFDVAGWQYFDTWIVRGTNVTISVFPDGPPDWWDPSSR